MRIWFFKFLKQIGPQLLPAWISTIGAISDGMHYGWSAPFIPILEKPDSPIPISLTDVTWLESIYLIGGLAGLPVTIYSVDRLGRKASILLAAAMSLVAWILIAVANNVIYLYVARFMVGLSGDVAFVAAPMYIAEIADKKIRGFLAGVIYVMMLVGILVVYAVGPFAPFYVCSIIGASFVIIQLISFPFMPDSPYYLLLKNQHEKARAHLLRLRTGEDIDKELVEITTAVERQKSERGRPQDLVISKSNRKALIIMVVLNAAQHFSSISVILMNLHSILKEAESEYVSFEIAGIIFSAFMLIAATIADFIVDKFGRKGLLISSSLLTGLSLLILAVYFTFKNNGYDVATISWVPIAAVMVYAAVFKFGLGIIPIVMTAELFPAKVKAMGMTLADFSYLFFGLLSVELYQRLINTFYLDLPFYIFASSTLLTALFAWLYIPETKGKTLDEIQFILKGEPIPERKLSSEEENGKTVDRNNMNLEELKSYNGTV
ncbi:facilitated trehalose transporter Tret1-like isoform X2 [Euwallacea fornicatus]|uniref:facilitated trehalose transporter Tret1-like isoform X2 n=1 Tax=Euwallacea fornicatus TaxID=995702 RepID=UPI00338FAEEE